MMILDDFMSFWSISFFLATSLSTLLNDFYVSIQLGRAVKALGIRFFLLHCQRFESHHWQFFSFFQKLTEKIVIQVRFSTPSAQNPEEKLIIPCPRWPNVPKNTGKPAKYREIVLCSDLFSSNKWKKIPNVAQCVNWKRGSKVHFF